MLLVTKHVVLLPKSGGAFQSGPPSLDEGVKKNLILREGADGVILTSRTPG